MKHWQRFPEIEVIALMELNRLIPRAKAFGLKDVPVDARLIKLLACDIRMMARGARMDRMLLASL